MYKQQYKQRNNHRIRMTHISLTRSLSWHSLWLSLSFTQFISLSLSLVLSVSLFSLSPSLFNPLTDLISQRDVTNDGWKRKSPRNEKEGKLFCKTIIWPLGNQRRPLWGLLRCIFKKSSLSFSLFFLSLPLYLSLNNKSKGYHRRMNSYLSYDSNQLPRT